jgi:hypothetical protein
MPPRSALWTLLLLTGALAALPLAMPATAIAQTSSGAAAFYEDTLDTSASTNIPNVQVSVFASRSQTPAGTVSTARVGMFDFTTHEIKLCESANFDLRIVPETATLALVIEGGVNCTIGEEVTVRCKATSNSGVSHLLTNGTAQVPGFQQFTIHGVIDEYSHLTCELDAFGLLLVSPEVGTARSVRQRTTG